MPRKSIVVLLVAFSAGLLLAVSGCGGGKSSATETVTVTESTQTESTDTGSTDTESTDTESTDTTATDTTETESMETTETDTSSTDTTGTEMESTETTDESTSGGSFSLANEDCQELATASASLSQAFSGGGTADWQSYVTFLNELADKAPDEIADDFRVLAEAYAKIADAMGGADMSNPGSMTPAQIAALTKLGQELDQAKLTAASQNISTWMTENCAGGAGG